MKISVTTKVNTKKFSSVDELPPDLRAIYERALANGLAGKSSISSTGPQVSTRLVVNGHAVGSTEELSEAKQKLYADACQLLKDSGATTATGSPTVGNTANDRVNLRNAVNSEGWMTKKQWTLILVVILSLGVALAIALM